MFQEPTPTEAGDLIVALLICSLIFAAGFTIGALIF